MSRRTRSTSVTDRAPLPQRETAWPHPGSSVQAWRYDVLHYQGVVEETQLSCSVLWIREAGLGVRKMIDLQEYSLRFCLPSGH